MNLKKLLITSFFLLLGSSVSAQFIQDSEMAYMPEMEMYDYCEYSNAEQDLLMSVVEMFETLAETKIVQRLYLDSDIQDLVRAYTAEYIQSLKSALAYCESGMWIMGLFPYDYKEMEAGLVEYATMLTLLKQHELNTVWKSDTAAYYFAQLRQILLWDNLDLLQSDNWLSTSAKMMLWINLEDNDQLIDVNLDLDANSIWSADATQMQWTYKLGGTVSVASEDENINTSGSIGVEMRLVDEHLYIWLEDFDIQLGDIQFANQYDAEWFNYMLEMLRLLQWKYVDIPLGIQDIDAMWYNMMWWSPLSMFGGISMQEDLVSMITQDWMTTYHVDWSTMYAGLNPVACGSLQMMQWVWACLDTRQEMMIHTQGKWMMYMTSNGNEVSMWITDVFAWDRMPIEMRNISNIPLISWNDSAITKIEVPLYDGDNLLWVFQYEDGNILFDVTFPNEEYNRYTDQVETDMVVVKMTGTIGQNTFDIQWSANDSEFGATRDIQSQWTLEGMQLQIQIDIEDSSEYPLDMSIVINLDQSQKIVEPIQIQAPSSDQIVDLESLMMY